VGEGGEKKEKRGVHFARCFFNSVQKKDQVTAAAHPWPREHPSEAQ
jgi:hypothetical protein